MNRAERIIKDAESAATDYRDRTGSDKLAGAYHQIGRLQYELRMACDMLANATNPSDCHDVTIDGITYGMQWDKGDECWLAYIGGQVVNVALSSELIDKLCDEAERIALDGEAA